MVGKVYLYDAVVRVGGLAGAICTSPLDVVKTRLQSTFYQQTIRQPNVRSRGLVFGHFVETGKLLMRINQIEGFRGYFKGLGPNLVGVIPARSINFFTYGNGKKFYTELNQGKETAAVHLISAATAGVITSTATNPIWVIKTRLQLEGASHIRKYGSSFECLSQILREEGIRGLYKGMSASYLGVAEGTIQWVIYENLKKKWCISKNELGQLSKDQIMIGGKTVQDWAGHLGAAATSKFVAACIAYPHEVIRTRLRQPSENGIRKYTGLWQCLRLVVKEEGVIALYGGMTAHLLRVVPNAAIMFFCYEAIVQKYGESQKSSL
ncbi:MAG: mitochondrial carrier domain-containing protein [Benjaminiella poitrasii]|nr:MAG: mitochondrial carrier domain-containing protein [Benjaminiella poitrasii]